MSNLSEEEKEAIERIKTDDEYYDILENIKQNKYNMWNVEKLMRDTTNGNYTEYEIAQSIVYLSNLIEKQQKELEQEKMSEEKEDINRLSEEDRTIKVIERLKEYFKNCIYSDKFIFEYTENEEVRCVDIIAALDNIVKWYNNEKEKNKDIEDRLEYLKKIEPEKLKIMTDSFNKYIGEKIEKLVNNKSI